MKTVFFDVDTQIDFMFPAGALYVPGAEKILDNVARLNRYAAAHAIPVISTIDAHAEDDREFKVWPPHCVVETAGQQKAAATILEKRVAVPNRAGALEVNDAQQILVEKQKNDCFTNVNLPALLRHLEADCYVVYGVVTEICVKDAAMGLLNTGKRVDLVTDAARSLNETASHEMLRDFQTRGGFLTLLHAVIAP